MAENSKIEWTHHTFNPWRGCTKVSAGCANCYAETMSARNPAVLGQWGPRGTRVIAAESYWRQPLKWDRHAAAAGERRRVFCASLADVFEGPETMPESEWPKVEAARHRLFNLIEQTPNLDWLLLTKRPQNLESMLPWTSEHAGEYRERFWHNVWIGTSVENQATADERIPHLLKVPARVRFLSCEPLLGPVDLKLCSVAYHRWRETRESSHDRGIHWIIVGGESGAQARPMHPEWARSLRDQAQAAGVAYFHKQNGEWELRDDSEAETGRAFYRVGKKASGRLLDGVEWNEFSG